jgi:Sulfotransferase domain
VKLIGAGFGRTGTMSLKAAIEQLGYGPCVHMVDLIGDPTPHPHWDDAAAGRPMDWEAAFEVFDGINRRSPL